MRQSRLLGFWALSALVALTVSCGPEVLPPTEVLVTVDSDLEIGRLLSSLRVTVQSADGASTSVASVPFVLASAGSEHEGRYTLPLTFRIPKREADAFAIVVQGYGPVGPGSTEVEVVVQKALLHFQAGTTLKTTIFLGSACFRELCDGVPGESLVCYPRADGVIGAGQCGPVPEQKGEPSAPKDEPSEVIPLGTTDPIGAPEKTTSDAKGGDAPMRPATTAPGSGGSSPGPATPEDGRSFAPPDASVTTAPPPQPLASDAGADSSPRDAGVRAPAPAEPLAPTALRMIDAHSGGTCAIRADRTVACWGAFISERQSATPVPIPQLTSVIELALGNGFGCALAAPGTVACWGSNVSGELGNGTLLSSWTPTPVEGLTGVNHIAAAGGSSCAVKADGTVACWGNNYDGLLGVGSMTDVVRPMPVMGLRDVEQLVHTGGIGCALKKDTTVVCWGIASAALGNGEPVDMRELPAPLVVHGPAQVVDLKLPVIGLTAGSNHICALLADRTVACWGENGNGQLGDGSTIPSSRPVAVKGLTGVLGLRAGFGHTCAIRSDRRLACWGSNRTGQVGGTAALQQTPRLVEGVTDVAEVTGGLAHTCVRRQDGQVLCWGSSQFGLGFATQDAISPPRPVVGL